MKHKFLIALLLFFFFNLSFGNIENIDGTMKVVVTGLKNSKGEIILTLFNKKDGFPDDNSKAFKQLNGKIINGTCTLTFENISEGEYAMSCFHDENNDKKINTTWYGKPVEGVACSNNAKGGISGPPSFDDAKFQFKNQTDIITLKIVYL